MYHSSRTSYDKDLQMYKSPGRVPTCYELRALRHYFSTRGLKLDQGVYSEPTGDFVELCNDPPQEEQDALV